MDIAMELEFREMKRSEIRQAAELATRSFDDYEYFTNWFPEKEERNRVGATKERHVLEAAQVMDTVLSPEEITRLEALADAAGIDTRGDWEHTMV